MSYSFEKARRGIAAAAVLAIALPAMAQEAAAPADPAAAPAPAERSGVEEIVITATKREANLQEVPIAVSAFTGDDLLSKGVTTVDEIEEVSPTIQINTSNGAAANSTIRIRGVGTTGNNPGLEAAVGTFIDGVYRSRSGQAFSDLLDIERVEVLRGPQGTLFGKNTSAGAISVITKKPVLSERDGSITAELGNFNHKRLAGSYSAPIIEGILGFRVGASWSDRDGYVQDANGPGSWVERDRYMIRGQLLWTPIETLEMRLIGDFSERDESCCPAGMLIEGPTSNRFNGYGIHELATSLGLGNDLNDIPLTSTPAAGAYPFVRRSDAQLGRREVGLNLEPIEDVRDWGVQFDANWDLDVVELTSITAYRKFGSRAQQDVDFTSADILNLPFFEDEYENFSEEFRLSATFGDFDLIFGIYGYMEDIQVAERLEFASQAGLFIIRNAVPVPGIEALLPTGTGYSANWDQESRGYAFFTNGAYHITEAITATVGARYSHETKDATGILNSGPILTENGSPNATALGLIGGAVPAGVNESWCGTLTGAGLGAFRTALRGFCDNASWRNEATEKEWTWTVSLAYALTDDINTYASVSRGYKAGGFNLDQESSDIVTDTPTGFVTSYVESTRFEPEFATAYEIGVKGTYLDGMARVNIAGFWTDFEDFQLNTFNGLGFTIANVGKVRARGFELESFLAPAENLTVNFGVAYSDARYGKGTGLGFPITLPDGSTDFVSAEGNRLTNAPAWTGNLGLLYETALPSTEWTGFASTNVRYTGRKNTGSNLHPYKMEPHHYFVNMQLGVRSPDQHWEASVWSNNLTNEYENNIIFDGVTQAGTQGTFYNPPRTYGVTLKYNFN
jgi:iron complex outermembrane receptor protein